MSTATNHQMIMPVLVESRKRAQTRQKPDPNNPNPKYEKNKLPVSLEDFMSRYLSSETEAWEQALVDELKEWIDDRISNHIKVSSKSRTILSVMNPEHVWADEGHTIMILSRRNLLTIDQTLIPHLNKHIHTILKNRMDAIRAEARQILEAVYASDEEMAAAEETMRGLEEADYSIANYGEHLKLQKTMRAELRAKFAVVEMLRYREVFLATLVEWEAKNRNIVSETRNGKRGSIGLLNYQSRFRMSVVSSLDTALTAAEAMIKEYESSTGKTFMLRGEPYAEYLKKQKQQIANVRTNFSQFTSDVLFFNDDLCCDDQEQGSANMAGRILHSDLEAIVVDGVAIPDPPKLPDASQEVEFAPVF